MASNDTPKCILLRGDPLYGEGEAQATITPGMLLGTVGSAITAPDGGVTATPAGVGARSPVFARENEVIGDGIDDDYAIGDNVLFMHQRQGDWVYALVGAATAAIAAGDPLEAAAGGFLTPETTNPVIGRALEAVDNSGGAEPARIKVEVL